MIERPPATLDRLWDDIPTGQAPIADLVAAGQAAQRSRRRATAAGAVAATVLVLGGGFLASQALTGPAGPHGDAFVADETTGDLTVELEVGVPAEVTALRLDANEATAIWNPESQSLIYVSRVGYSGSCPPGGRLNESPEGLLALELVVPDSDLPCTADANQVTVTINGLTTSPSQLQVSELDDTRTLPVRTVDTDDAPQTKEGVAPNAKKRGTPISVSSHCGVRSVWVKGRLWLASPPLGGHNPPQGWDENETSGFFTVTAPGRGLFRGDGGQMARFRLAEPGQPDPNADCE